MRVLINTHVDRLDTNGLMSLLPQWRRERALRYRREEDRRLSVAVWMLLQQAYKAETGSEELPDVAFLPDGKPYFPSHADLFFNLSHTDGAAACVMEADRRVGIDIERVCPLSQEVVQAVMNADEQALIAASGRPSVEFARLWTRKESYLKCIGAGLTGSLPTLLRHIHGHTISTFVTADEQYVYSVCVKD